MKFRKNRKNPLDGRIIENDAIDRVIKLMQFIPRSKREAVAIKLIEIISMGGK